MVVSDIVLFLTGTYLLTLRDGFAGSLGSARRLLLMLLPLIWYFVALITAEPRFSNSRSEPVDSAGEEYSLTGRAGKGQN